MHWNVAPDALPGSARLVHVLDRWLNNCLGPPNRKFFSQYSFPTLPFQCFCRHSCHFTSWLPFFSRVFWLCVAFTHITAWSCTPTHELWASSISFPVDVQGAMSGATRCLLVIFMFSAYPQWWMAGLCLTLTLPYFPSYWNPMLYPCTFVNFV